VLERKCLRPPLAYDDREFAFMMNFRGQATPAARWGSFGPLRLEFELEEKTPARSQSNFDINPVARFHLVDMGND